MIHIWSFCLDYVDFGRGNLLQITKWKLDLGVERSSMGADLGSKESTADSGMPWFKCLLISS